MPKSKFFVWNTELFMLNRKDFKPLEGFYRQLHNACSAEMQFSFKGQKKLRSGKRSSQLYAVERLISCRKRNRKVRILNVVLTCFENVWCIDTSYCSYFIILECVPREVEWV
jgi:hypothetical protein